MGGGSSRPIGNSHGNNALLHQQLVEHALLRREEMQEMARRGARKYKPNPTMQQVVREVEREIQDDEQVAMYGEDTRLQSRLAESNRQYDERTKMMKEDKPPKRGGRGRGRRD